MGLVKIKSQNPRGIDQKGIRVGFDEADPKHVIARDYEMAASEYARYAEPLIYRHVTAPLAKALAGISGRILEIASGTGALGRQLENVVALDLVRAQLRQNPVPLRVQADVDRLPFPDDSFAAAACAFGINHFPDPHTAIAEMARVAPTVALLTWERPEIPFPPKQIVLEVIERQVGRARTRAGEIIEALTQAIGSVAALTDALTWAGLDPEVDRVQTEVQWPGADDFVDSRLAMCGMASLDRDEVRRVAVAEIEALPSDSLTWRPCLILGVGRRAS